MGNDVFPQNQPGPGLQINADRIVGNDVIEQERIGEIGGDPAHVPVKTAVLYMRDRVLGAVEAAAVAHELAGVEHRPRFPCQIAKRPFKAAMPEKPFGLLAHDHDPIPAGRFHGAARTAHAGKGDGLIGAAFGDEQPVHHELEIPGKPHGHARLDRTGRVFGHLNGPGKHRVSPEHPRGCAGETLRHERKERRKNKSGTGRWPAVLSP